MKETLLDWLGTFWRVLITPTPETFLREAQKAQGKFGSAVIWLFIYAIYVYVLGSFASGGALGLTAFVALVSLVPLTGVLVAAAMNFISQRIFRQKKDYYDALLYLSVAILLPVFFIFAPLAAFISQDIFKILSSILLFYQVFLLVIAIKTIVNIEYWQALVVAAFSIIFGIIIGLMIILLVISTISPQALTPK